MRRTALLALLCLLPTSVSAQVGSLRVSFSAPTAASLGKFGDVPVSLASGLPDISVPIFTVRGKTLELPIALRYHGSGIRVEDIASWVGTGWALESGGTITRTVRGLVDESGSGYYNTGHVFYEGTNWQNPSVNFFQSIVNKTVDPEPDQFFFNFAGRSGQFVMGPIDAAGVIKEIRTIPYQKIKFEPDAGFTQWTVTTEDGTKYVFAAQERTTDLSYSAPTGMMPDNYGDTYTSSWHLTEIRAPGGDLISLSYRADTVRHRHGSYVEKFDQRYGNPAPCVPDQFETIGEQQIVTQRLDTIKAAQHWVVFAVADSLRRDGRSPSGVRQEPSLELISVRTPTGTVIRRFLFEHDYFPGERLRLKNVYEQDPAGVSLPPYTFTYDGQTFPSRTSYEQDHWGYWNGRYLNQSLIPDATNLSGQYFTGADRSPDTAKVKVGSLTRITFPTGGYNEFVWEANDYGAIGQSQTQPYDLGPPQAASVTSTDYQGFNQTSFTVGGAVAVPVTFDYSLLPTGCGTQIGCPYVELVGIRTWHTSGRETIQLSPGTYTLRSYSDIYDGMAYVSAGWRDKMAVNRKAGGGLRVREVKGADGMGNVQVRKFNYTLASNPSKSSGLINVEPAYHFTYASQDCGYFSRASQSKLPLGSGTSVSYSEVTVLYGASGEHGSARETFRSIVHAPDQTPLTPQLPYVRTTSYEWKRGQRLDSFDYNSAGQTQRLVRSSYAFQDALPATTRSFRGLSTHSFSTQWGGTGGVYNPFEVHSAWYYQDSDTTFTYNEGGTSSFSSVRRYSYGNTEHVQLTQTVETNSDGTSRITRLKYPADYASGSGNAEAIAITAMKGAAHMHSALIEQWVSDSVGSTVRVMQAEVTTYKTFNTGQFLPHTRSVLKSAAPVTDFTPSSVNGGFTKDSRYLWVESAAARDAAGRITSHNDRWGYTTNYGYGGNANAAFLSRSRRCESSAACSSGAGGLIQAAGHDSLGNVTTMRDSLTYRRFTYDSFGRLREVKNHGFARVQGYGYSYSRTGPSWSFNLSSPNVVVDTTYLQHTPTPLRVVRWTYFDGLGRAIQTVVQDGSTYIVTAQQYDAMGRAWRKWKPYPRDVAGYDSAFATNAANYHNGYHGAAALSPYVETQYTPDALNRVKRVIPEFLGTTAPYYSQYAYGIEGQQSFAEVTDEVGMKTRSYKDAWGNEVKTILGHGDALASTTILAYNVLGQRTQVTDPRGLIISYTYNTQGYQSARTSPDAGTTSQLYDVMNNLRYRQDANQDSTGKVYFTNYDFGYRPLTSGLGTATFTGLDPNSSTPPALETNNANWLTVRAYDAKPSTAAFPWSRVSTQINAVTLDNVYGRLAATANKSNGAWQVQLFSYDADGRVATRYTFTEAFGGASVLTTLNTTVNYTRDLRDSVTVRSATIGTGSWNQWYDYDGRGLLWKVFASTSATKPTTPDVTYSYRPSGKVLTRQFQGGVLDTLRYTIREQLDRIGDVSAAAGLFAAKYVYNPDGTVKNAEFRSEGAPTAQKRYVYDHAYDNRKRLIHAQFYNVINGAWSATDSYLIGGMAYDRSGNLNTLVRYRANATPIDWQTYATASTSNRLNSLSEAYAPSTETWDAEAGGFTYDVNGNMLTAPAPYSIIATTYDHMNLPMKFKRGADSTAYRYNAEGQRIAKRVNTGNIQVYILDGRTTLAFYNVNNATGVIASSHQNIFAGDRVVGRQVSGAKRYYHTDILGSTRAVVADNGAIVESYDSDPWGVLLDGRTLAGATKEGFTGKERDAETGFDYFGLRYYMPAVGRWTTVDPPADMFSAWSPYNYVFNNPVKYTDPLGLCPPEWLCRGIGAAAGDEATEYWADKAANSTGASRAGATAMGLFASLWTRDTYAKTSVVLGAAKGLDLLIPHGDDTSCACVQNDDGTFKTPDSDPDEFTKLRGAQGWRDSQGHYWKKDKKHKDHWDVSDRQGKRLREVDFDGNQIWPDGPKNKNR